MTGSWWGCVKIIAWIKFQKIQMIDVEKFNQVKFFSQNLVYQIIALLEDW